MKVFVSATPRCQADGSGLKDKIEFVNTIGVDFLNCASNTKQHIQLIQFLNEEISIPSDVYDYVFNGDKIIQYLSGNVIQIDTLKQNIQQNYMDCDYFIFEISSLNYVVDTNDFTLLEKFENIECEEKLQSSSDLYSDLQTIRNLIPTTKKIIFQTPFRHNVIHRDDSLVINEREIIYETVKSFCEDAKNVNCVIYDPSVVIQEQTFYLYNGNDDFTPEGLFESWKYIYNNFIESIPVVDPVVDPEN